jgi:hypothetical protein
LFRRDLESLHEIGGAGEHQRPAGHACGGTHQKQKAAAPPRRGRTTWAGLGSGR